MTFVRINIAACVILLLLMLESQYAQSKPGPNSTEIFGIAFIKNMFSNVALNDASAAIKVYVNELQKNFASGYEVKALMFENCEDLLRSFSRENVSIINLSVTDYLLYSSKLSITPVMVSAVKDDPYEEYIILTKKNSGINTLEDLNGRRVSILPRPNNPVPYMWLEVLLKKNKVRAADKIMERISEGKVESQMVMSVFFGQLDACVVSKNAFQVTSELNPQMGKQLKILASSPGYVIGLSCFGNGLRKSRFRDELYSASMKASSYPAGHQLLTLMRINNIIPFKEEYLAGVKKLLSDYNSFHGKSKGR